MTDIEKSQPFSERPCAKCGELKVTVELEDVPSGGTDYVIRCLACKHEYRVDGPDA